MNKKQLLKLLEENPLKTLSEIDTISENISLIRKKMDETGNITIREDSLVALCDAVAPIKCYSNCLFSKGNGSCFISPVQLRYGFCQYYQSKTADKSVKDIDRTDLPGGFSEFINQLRQQEGKD